MCISLRNLSVVLLSLLCLSACSRPAEKISTEGSGSPRPQTSTSVSTSTTVSAPESTIVEETASVSTTSSSSAPSSQHAQNISIDEVEAANPVIVSGHARTFENNVALRVRGRDGLVAEGFTTSRGEMGQHNPYRATLWLTRDPGKTIVVEALEYSAKDGAETNLARVEKPFSTQLVNAVLYLPDEKCTGVSPHTRAIPKSISMARLLVEALIAGPTAQERSKGAAAVFPSGSRVESVNLRDGVLTVDFNERLQNVGGACRAQMIRASVSETLRHLPGIRKVVITAAGSEKLALQP